MKSAVALATAYVIALQLLLTSALAAQMSVATFDPSSHFCNANPTDATGQQGQADAALIKKAGCAVCVFASQAPVLSATAVVHVAQYAQRLALSPAAVSSVSPQPQHSPRTSQGPPLNA
jgi:hypothetical protein